MDQTKQEQVAADFAASSGSDKPYLLSSPLDHIATVEVSLTPEQEAGFKAAAADADAYQKENARRVAATANVPLSALSPRDLDAAVYMQNEPFYERIRAGEVVRLPNGGAWAEFNRRLNQSCSDALNKHDADQRRGISKALGLVVVR